MSPTSPRTDDLHLIAEFSLDLRDAHYTVEMIADVLGTMATAALNRGQAVAARDIVDRELTSMSIASVSPQSAVAVLIKAWMLGDRVPVELLDGALPRAGANGAVRLGLGDLAEGEFLPSVDLSPYATDIQGDLWVASDQTALQLQAPLPTDHVLGIGGASLTLAGVTIRRPVARALDLGVGCGIQTLHLLGHAHHVTATDIDERALAFTQFNLLLNADALNLDPQRLSDRVSLRCGSMLEPVAGESFDLVVSNPPFVISPMSPPAGPGQEDEHTDEIYTYRETGVEGDGVVAELISTVGTVLAPGGTAQLLANWERHSADEGSWDSRLRDWVHRSPVPLDAWIIQRDLQDPAGYAETWLQDSSDLLDPRAYRDGYRRYLRDFARRNVEQIGFGYVWLRRAATADSTSATAGTAGASNESRLRIRTEEHTGPITQPLGPAWGEAIHAWDLVAEPKAVRDYWPTVPFHVTEERHQHFGAEHPEAIMARQGAGFQRYRQLDTATAGILAAADGELTAGQLISAVAALLELDDDAVEQLTEEIAELAIDGFVILNTR